MSPRSLGGHMQILIPLLGLLLLSFESNASSKILVPWTSQSDPSIMSKNFEKKFSKLPLEGEAKSPGHYWSSDYWAHFRGGINQRWYSYPPVGFNLKSPSFEEALKMSQEELKALAPSEKFDLLRGAYDYPLKTEVSKRVSPRRKEWEGICHGWAMASLNHPEPIPRVLSNPQGLMIPFGASDVKALLSYYYAYKYDPVTTDQMGRRCTRGMYCYREDMNAGAFHIVLSNRVGLENKSFIADIENKHEVWNQVVKDYKSEIINDQLKPLPDSADGTAKVIRLKTKVRVAFNIKANSWFPSNGTENHTLRDLDYEYFLDVNRDGKIIGGKWISKLRPDFLWAVARENKFKGSMSELNRLLRSL